MERLVFVDRRCEHCGGLFMPKRANKPGRFCSDRCRAAHRREGGMPCVIKRVTALARGGFSITVFSPTAPTLQPGSRCLLTVEGSPGMDARSSIDTIETE